MAQVDGCDGDYCDWSDYGDYYGYSLISDPNFGGDTCIYAPGGEVAIPQTTAIIACLLLQIRHGAGVYPSGETTYGMGFINPYWPFVSEYMMDLSGGSFNRRWVTEVFSGDGSYNDQCSRPENGSTLPNPAASLWYVSSILGANPDVPTSFCPRLRNDTSMPPISPGGLVSPRV